MPAKIRSNDTLMTSIDYALDKSTAMLNQVLDGYLSALVIPLGATHSTPSSEVSVLSFLHCLGDHSHLFSMFALKQQENQQ